MEPVSPALVGRFSMKVKEESEKIGLNFNIQKTKIMASSPSHLVDCSRRLLGFLDWLQETRD